MAASTSYRVGILTISDTASQDASTDKSGPILASLFSAKSYSVESCRIVADQIDNIQRVVREWVDSPEQGMDIVVTTGGTGFGTRDVTPEAITPLLDKQTTGLTHALFNYSLSKTPLAALSRMTSGIRHRRTNPSTLALQSLQAGSALIVALPGSSKAVEECCHVLLADNGLLSHALDLLAGGSGKAKHEEVRLTGTETDTGKAHHNHHHHHTHQHQHNHDHGHQAPKARTLQGDVDAGYKTHDPTKSVATRHRSSPYPIIPMDDALQSIIQHTHTNDLITLPVNSHLRGYILAEDIAAPRELPPRATTNVDGYALKSGECPPGPYEVVTKEAAFKGKCVFRINTGQALPEGADAVVMVEDTELLEQDKDEEISIQIKAQIIEGENVRVPGSDVKKGQLVLKAGVRIGELGGEIGTLAFLGYSSVRVYRKPKVAILSTGNELYDVKTAQGTADEDAWGFRIFDSNRPSLSAALEGAGFDVLDLGITTDDVGSTLDMLNRGLEEADVVLSTGGTSMGESDLLKPLMERSIKNGKVHFGRVAMKPGKPTTFATATSTDGKPRLLFALPGNPASALVCFYVFVMPCLRKMSGFPPAQYELAKIKVKLLDEMRLDPRPEYHRVIIHSQDGQLCASSTGSQRSSGMHSMATANGLVCVPVLQEGGLKSLVRGSLAEAILLGPIV
ncbi:hypothetical protein CBS101457_002179 [Exobasidium rhododendri]|nr:hypothetical protein CBS101457_002179 [Exobasidium rhododendri]